jgi:hypothetical protein
MEQLDKAKTPIWYKTSFMVVFYAVVTSLLMALQLALHLCLKFNWYTTNPIFRDFINGNLVLPMETISWFWMAISAAYIGVDRTAYAIKTANTKRGQADMGNPATIRHIIFISGLLALESLVCNGLVEADFQLDAFFTAFGTAITFYVAGQKAIKSVKYIDGKLDANGDGIPDEDQTFDTEKPNDFFDNGHTHPKPPKPPKPHRPVPHHRYAEPILDTIEESEIISKEDVL